MTGDGAADVLAAYSRSREAAGQVEARRLALRRAADERLAEEAELARLHDELERFTGWNAATWWPRLTGRIRDRQATITASIAQQQTATQRAVVAHERALQQSADAAHLVDQLPQARENAALALTGGDGEEARVILAKMEQVRKQLEITAQARLLALQTTRALGRAEGWSTYDILGGGLVATAIKHEHVDDANESAATLTELLTQLRPQLQALGAPTSYFSVSTHNAGADLWFDNVVSDVTTGSRIQESGDRVDRLQVGLAKLAEVLGQQHQDLVQQLDALIDASTGAGPAS